MSFSVLDHYNGFVSNNFIKKDIKQTLQRPTKNQQRVAMLNQKIKRYEENINQLRL